MRVIIAGDGPDLERELEEAERMIGRADEYLAVNRAFLRAGERRVGWVATAHPGPLTDVNLRGAFMVSPMRHPRADVIWPCVRYTCGGSGMYAVLFALGGLRARRVVLCGVPMDAGPYLEAFEADHCWEERACSDFKGRVRSMSGRTRDLLGAPDAAWLAKR